MNDVSTLRRTYKNPPVVEAVARLKFLLPIEWNVTTPGLLYERVRKDYPQPPEVRNAMRADLSQTSNDGGPTSASLAFSTGPQEMVFYSEERNRLLVVGPEGMSVHGLPPYEGWEALESRLFQSYEKIREVLPESAAFSACSVRYINQVAIAGGAVDLGEYMTIQFVLPAAFPQQMTGFLDRIEVVYPDAPATLAFTWASLQPQEDKPAFLLDLDLVATPPEAVDLDAIREMLNDLKARETEAFEGLLQDKLREQFDEIH